MVDLQALILSKDGTKNAQDSKITGHQRDSEASQSQEFNKLFERSVGKVAMPESGIKKPEHGEILPNKCSPGITVESKTLRGGMLLLVGGDEPTNDVIEEFAQSQGVEAELLALLMKEPSSVSERKQPVSNTVQQISALSSGKPFSQEKVPHGIDLLAITARDTTKQNTLLMATPSKFIAPESTSLPKAPLMQLQSSPLLQNSDLASKANNPVIQAQPSATLQDLSLPLNFDSTRLGGTDDDSILIPAKNIETDINLIDGTGKRTSNRTAEGRSLLSYEKGPHGTDLLAAIVKETTKQNTLLIATPRTFIAPESTLLSQEKAPRAIDLLSGAGKETTQQNTLLMAAPSKFVAPEFTSLPKPPLTQLQSSPVLQNSGVASKAKNPLIQAQPSPTLQNLSLPLNLDGARLGGADDDSILIPIKNIETDINLMDVTSKRTSSERPGEVLTIKQEQHSDMSKRLAEALAQRLTAQISKGVWQVELDIHPKALGRIEIHLEMRGGELEAHFNASKVLTRELLQDGMPRLKEELREHGIETAYLGLGSGKQGANDGNLTPSDYEEDIAVAARQAETAVPEPNVGVMRHHTLIDGLDITI
tara:strand:- start:3492 stop:5270 length:1779 start_codon:yes stop_codon:yes gene_type:complete